MNRNRAFRIFRGENVPAFNDQDLEIKVDQIVVYGYCHGMQKCVVRKITAKAAILEPLDLRGSQKSGHTYRCKSPALLWILDETLAEHLEKKLDVTL